MAKTESTAINDLINLVATATPRKPAPDEDLMFQAPSKKKNMAVSIPRMTGTVPGAGEVEPLPRGRGAVGTTQNKITPPQVRVTTAPPSRQTTIPPLGLSDASEFEVDVETPAPTPPPTRNVNNSFDLSAASSIGHNLPQSSIGISLPPSPLAPWEEPEPAIAPRHEETWVGTVQTPKTATTAQWLAKLAPAMGAMIVIGIFVGGYVAFDGQGGKQRTPIVSAPPPAPVKTAAIVDDDQPLAPPAVVAEPVKAEEPKAAEPVTTEEPAPSAPKAARPVFTDVRLDSKPSGATVTLIDGDKRMFIGTTPIATSVDISRQYDVEFTYSARPPVVEHLDPRTTTKLAVEIRRAKSTEAAPVATPAPLAAAPKAEAPKAEKAVAKPAVPAPAVVEPSGQGILMISSKPPCEILIDGKPTGLMTPQRALPLSAGPHKVTLVNSAEKIKKTLSIQITADQPTKVIQDLMAK